MKEKVERTASIPSNGSDGGVRLVDNQRTEPHADESIRNGECPGFLAPAPLADELIIR